METLRKQCMAWLEQTNPLRGLSISRAGSIYDMARKFGSPRLQYTYNEIEKTDPVVYVCCDRRESALAGLEWSFIPRAHADETLAQEQAEALTKFTDQIENFSEVLSHLDGAFFRGYAHAQPIWDGKTVAHVNLLDSWNFLTDPDGNWYWNPACHETPSGLDTVDGAQLVSLTRRRSIDYPILFIYIRKALGERDYGRFIERHGIPHAAIIMAPGTEEKDKAKYLAAANAWNNGQDLALPNGSDIKLATEARGTDPFTPFVEHQDKYTVLLATGATLTTLAQADTGSLAGGAHMEVWREIVARDGVNIAEAMNRDLFRRYLELEFPGRPMAAKFVLSNEKKQTAEEVADLAGKLKTAGYLVDQQVLEEKVGLKLVKDETPAPNPGFDAPFMNKRLRPEVEVEKIDRQPQPSTSTSDLLTAFAKDTGAAGKAVAELLQNPSPEAAAAILVKLDTLLPDDPAMAAVLAEAMAAEFGAKVENKDVQRVPSGHGNGGQFTGKTNQPKGVTHTPEEEKRIADYQASTDQSVVDFYEQIKDIDDAETLSKAKCKIGIVSQEYASRVKELTGLDTEGWTIELRGNRAKHIDIRHGGSGKQDQSLADSNDVGRINYVMQHFDSIDYCYDKHGNRVFSGEYQDKNGPAPVLETRMKIDGTFAVQEAVPDSKWKKIYIVSARIEKSKEP